MRTLALLAALVLAGCSLADETKVKDEEAILGTWKVEQVEPGSAEGSAFAKVGMAFKKDGKFTLLTPDGKERDGTYKIDPAAKAKTLDIIADPRSKSLGLYALDGDTLTLAIPELSGKDRPTEFKADPKVGTVVITLKRVKDK